jgi:hypothetical protein
VNLTQGKKKKKALGGETQIMTCPLASVHQDKNEFRSSFDLQFIWCHSRMSNGKSCRVAKGK